MEKMTIVEALSTFTVPNAPEFKQGMVYACPPKLAQTLINRELVKEVEPKKVAVEESPKKKITSSTK